MNKSGKAAIFIVGSRRKPPKFGSATLRDASLCSTEFWRTAVLRNYA
jgi:hypothetical protein